MKNSRKAWIVFRRITLLLFIIFLINYYQVESGNSNSNLSNKTILTEEKIREFEEDVKNGEFVDIKNYTEIEEVDNSNKVANAGYEIGEGINDFINNKVVKVFEYIGQLFK